MSDKAPAGSSPRVSVLDRGSEDRSRKALAKLAVVAVPLVLWLIAWSLWSPLLALVGFAIILTTALAAIAQFFTVVLTSKTGRRLRRFQERLLDLHGHTFAFLLTLTTSCRSSFGNTARRARSLEYVDAANLLASSEARLAAVR